MNPLRQRIAIAECCGWLRIKDSAGFTAYMEHPQLGRIDTADDLPDYLTSLDAMHDAVMHAFVTHEDKLAYITCLVGVVLQFEYVDSYDVDAFELWLLTAECTAAQQAESFLRAKGLWTEDE